ncbi:MAG: MaoC family dehydratase [Pseudomonadota bacterium]
MLIFNSIDELAEHEGQELGVSDWLCVDQKMIDAFAAVTNDHQWIHVDQEKAVASPLGSTIAHGYLILSLIPALGDQVYKLNNVDVAINAGLNWLRFVQPVRAGQHVRARIKLSKVQQRPVGPSRALVEPTVEIKETGKIACKAEMVFMITMAKSTEDQPKKAAAS